MADLINVDGVVSLLDKWDPYVLQLVLQGHVAVPQDDGAELRCVRYDRAGVLVHKDDADPLALVVVKDAVISPWACGDLASVGVIIGLGDGCLIEPP